MRRIVIILISVLSLIGCSLQKNTTGSQGITGEVRWVEGNLMPTVGDVSLSDKAKGIPIEREIYIFNAVTREDVVSGGGSFYKLVNSKLIDRVKTRKDGKFKRYLPPGKYSIFVMEENGYFANTFDGENYINPVTVQANSFTKIQILVNYKAYY